MPIAPGCHFRDGLLYDLENLTWYEEIGDGTVRIGITAIATARAGQFIGFRPLRVGRAIGVGKPCATLQSGKWVGPLRVAVAGEIVAINEALEDRPGAINADPYGCGWMVVLRPVGWEAAKAALIPGTAVAALTEARMAAGGQRTIPS